MLKLIHTADLHLGSKMQSHLDEAQARKRRAELFETFERMVEYARKNQVRAILLCGDVFEYDKPSSIDVERFIDTVRDAEDVDFLYISGNHDSDALFKYGEMPQNLTLMREWTVKKYADTAIVGASYPLVLSEMPALCESDTNIVMLHGELTDKNEGADYSIPHSSLKNKNIDYLALGHIHKYSQGRLDERGIYCFSGTPEGRGFDEPGADGNSGCGFILITVDGGVSSEFVPIAKRNVRCYEYDVSEHKNDFEAVRSAIKTVDADVGDMVRLIFTGEASFDTSMLCERARDQLTRYFAVSVKNETRMKIDLSDYKNDPTLLGEFVRTVTDPEILASVMPGGEILEGEALDRVLSLGIGILSGEDK